jgi:hypothetical protein
VLLPAAIAKRGSDCVMRVVSADSETMRPPQTLANQIVLADHALTIVDQVLEQIEDLRRQADDDIATPQLALGGIQLVVVKTIEQRSSQRLKIRCPAA